MHVEIASILRQTKLMRCLGFAMLPEHQVSVTAAVRPDDDLLRVQSNSPGNALQLWLRQILNELFSVGPVEFNNRRIADPGECVCDGCNSRRKESRTVSIELQRAKAANLSSKTFVVLAE